MIVLQMMLVPNLHVSMAVWAVQLVVLVAKVVLAVLVRQIIQAP
jgi:hypothetical protein